MTLHELLNSLDPVERLAQSASVTPFLWILSSRFHHGLRTASWVSVCPENP
jgi:hypothetical protein